MKRILVVDDDLQIAILEKLLLEQDGFVVESAANGKEALEKIAGGPFDAVLTDFEMPLMDGMEFAREMRKLHPETPIVMVTAMKFMEEKALALGIVGLIPKPLTKCGLLIELMKFVANKED